MSPFQAITVLNTCRLFIRTEFQYDWTMNMYHQCMTMYHQTACISNTIKPLFIFIIEIIASRQTQFVLKKITFRAEALVCQWQI